jgi:hypothetical protein
MGTIRIAAATALSVVAVGWAGQAASARVLRTIKLTPHELRYPERIALGPSGRLYVLDSGDRDSSPVKASVYSVSGRLLRRWRIPTDGSLVPNMAVDSVGNLYVVAARSRADRTSLEYSILKYSPTGELLSARWAALVWDSRQGSYPGLAADGQGHVLVTFDGRIDTFDGAGERSASWQYLAPGDLKNEISGLAVATSGTIYVADRKGIAVLDSAGNVVSRIVPAGDRLGQVSRPSLVAGPAGSLYAVQAQRIQKFGPDGQFLGAVGSDRHVHWLSAAVAPDGGIYVPQNRFSGASGVVLKLAPITTVDVTPPSIALDSFSLTPGQAKGVLGRLTYTLSEDASFRISLLRLASTKDPRHREFGRYLHIGTFDKGVTPAGTHRLLLRLRSFRSTGRRPPGTYRLVLVARDDAGSESRSVRVSFSIGHS